MKYPKITQKITSINLAKMKGKESVKSTPKLSKNIKFSLKSGQNKSTKTKFDKILNRPQMFKSVTGNKKPCFEKIFINSSDKMNMRKIKQKLGKKMTVERSSLRQYKREEGEKQSLSRDSRTRKEKIGQTENS